MNRKDGPASPPEGFDFKAAGYLISIASVLFLGAVAAAKESPPGWYYPALIAGMATSILGMGFRYLSHLREKREIREARAKAKARPNGVKPSRARR